MEKPRMRSSRTKAKAFNQDVLGSEAMAEPKMTWGPGWGCLLGDFMVIFWGWSFFFVVISDDFSFFFF